MCPAIKSTRKGIFCCAGKWSLVVFQEKSFHLLCCERFLLPQCTTRTSWSQKSLRPRREPAGSSSYSSQFFRLDKFCILILSKWNLEIRCRKNQNYPEMVVLIWKTKSQGVRILGSVPFPVSGGGSVLFFCSFYLASWKGCHYVADCHYFEWM